MPFLPPINSIKALKADILSQQLMQISCTSASIYCGKSIINMFTPGCATPRHTLRRSSPRSHKVNHGPSGPTLWRQAARWGHIRAMTIVQADYAAITMTMQHGLLTFLLHTTEIINNKQTRIDLHRQRGSLCASSYPFQCSEPVRHVRPNWVDIKPVYDQCQPDGRLKLTTDSFNWRHQ